MPNQNTDGADNDGRETETEDTEPWERQSRNKSGQWGSSLRVADLRAYLNDDPLGDFTGAIADEFDVSADTVRRRCRELVDDGELLERKGSSEIFWQPITWSANGQGDRQSGGKQGQWGPDLAVKALGGYIKDEPPGAFTSEIVEEFDTSRDTARRWCREWLVEEGEVRERKGSSEIFWQPITT